MTREIWPGVFLFKGVLTEEARERVMAQVEEVALASPFRRYRTAMGQMSIDMTNAGAYGWVADQSGYRYEETDPLTKGAWPAMPVQWADLALCFARLSGFDAFEPNSCLINRYQGSAQLGMHVDKDEAPEVRSQPIVSISLGASARFAIGGLKRKDPAQTIMLDDGDVLVMGGPGRLRYHAVRRVYTSGGLRRYNLTLRRAR